MGHLSVQSQIFSPVSIKKEHALSYNEKSGLEQNGRVRKNIFKCNKISKSKTENNIKGKGKRKREF